MTAKPEVVRQGLSEIRTKLARLQKEAFRLAQIAGDWTERDAVQKDLLRAIAQRELPQERAFRSDLGVLEAQKDRILRDIELWIDTSFDAPTQKALKGRVFPAVHVLVSSHAVDIAAEQLAADVKRLMEEAEDIDRRLPFFAAPPETAVVTAVPLSRRPGSVRESIFIAYSREDGRWLNRLKVFLRPLSRSGTLSVWEDTQLEPGTRWRQEIERALKDSTLAILLLSPDFVASDFIGEVELPTILHAEATRGLAVVPLFVSPCDIPEAISRFQSVNRVEKTLEDCSKAEADRMLTDLVRRIRERNDPGS